MSPAKDGPVDVCLKSSQPYLTGVFSRTGQHASRCPAGAVQASHHHQHCLVSPVTLLHSPRSRLSPFRPCRRRKQRSSPTSC